MYKDYNMTQLTLTMETSVLISTNDIVETIPETEFRHHRGATSYHPKVMLKVVLYAYTQSVFSGRKIEKLLNDSITMMWLLQHQKPSYKTFNRYCDYDEINDEFICPNNKRLGFKRYAYRDDKYGFKRDFKLFECDDCSECTLKHQCMNFNSKTNKK